MKPIIQHTLSLIGLLPCLSFAQVNVATGGNVGIGTAGPTYKLEVTGTVSATDFRGPVGASAPNTVSSTVLTASSKAIASFFVGTGPLASYESSTGGLYMGFASGASFIRSVSNNSGGAAPLAVQIGNGNHALTIATSRAIQLNAYGAGTLTTDSSGNVTTTSDSRAKTTIGDFTTGLTAIRQLQPKKYHWKKSTGLNVDDLNVSVYAQDLIAAGLSEAVSTQRTEQVMETVDLTVTLDEYGREIDLEKTTDPSVRAKASTKTIQVSRPKKNAAGEVVTTKVDATYYSVNDRAIIAALINAVKELADKNDALETRLAALESSKSR